MDVYGATFLTPSSRAVETVCSVEASERHPSLVAVGFEGGSIQLLHGKHLTTYAEIAASQDRSVRRLVSIQGRLFSAGIHGNVSEWDLTNLAELYSVDSNNGAIWDLKVITRDGRPMLAAATESGAIVVYKILDADLEVFTTLKPAKRGVRALSVTQEGDAIFSGDCAGSISRWKQSGKSYQCDMTMSVDKKGTLDTLVWQLHGLGDGLLVSGDSLGCVAVWDAELCVRQQLLREHQADVLAICGSAKSLFSAGVDAKVAAFSKLQDKVAFTDSFFMHTRDVSALCLLPDGRLISGGADGQLAIFKPSARGSFSPLKLSRVHASVSSSADGSLHAIRTSSSVNLCVLKPDPVILASLDTEASLAVMAPSGRYILISGLNGSRLLSFDIATLEISKVAHTRKKFSNAVFDGDDGVFVSTANGRVLHWDLTKDYDDGTRIIKTGVESEQVTCMAVLGKFSEAADVKRRKTSAVLAIGTAQGSILLIRDREVVAVTQAKSNSDASGFPIVDLAFHVDRLFALTAGGTGDSFACGGSLLLSLDAQSLDFKWKKNLRRIESAPSSGDFYLVIVVNSKPVVIGERALARLSEGDKWTAFDTISGGFGLVYGAWANNQDNSKSRLTPEADLVLFGALPVAIEKSLAKPFQRKSFHK